MNRLFQTVRNLLVAASTAFAATNAPALRPVVQVQGGGVLASDLLQGVDSMPRVVVTNSPAPGSSVLVSRAAVAGALADAGVALDPAAWGGPQSVRVVRRMREVDENEVRNVLTAELQRLYARERGEVELRLTRPWRAVQVADENYEVRLLDVPQQGLSPVMTLRFQFRAGSEVLGEWQQPVGVRLWAEVFVAASPVRRGLVLPDADLTQERRDLLATREALSKLPANPSDWELAESVNPGMPLTRRSLRLRSVVLRGRQIDAVVRSGLMEISTKVEALEDGIPGQTIRVRNVRSRKELRARVEGEDLVVVTL